MNHEDSIVALQNKFAQLGIRTLRIRHRVPDLIVILDNRVVAIEVVRTHVTLETQDDNQYDAVIHTRNVATLNFESHGITFETLNGETFTKPYRQQ